MNLVISLFLTYDGDQTEIEAILSDLSEVLTKYGYGNSEDENANLISLILLHGIGEETNIQEELDNSIMALVPVKGDKVEQD